jgi:hypothetical protein
MGGKPRKKRITQALRAPRDAEVVTGVVALRALKVRGARRQAGVERLRARRGAEPSG